MARQRKFLQIDGKAINGVSRHRPSGRFYIIDQTGRRVYSTDWREARANYQAQLLRDMDDVARARMLAETDVRHAIALRQLQAHPLYEEISRGVAVEGGVVMEGDLAMAESLEAANHLADMLGVPKQRVLEDNSVSGAVSTVSNPKLSAVGEAWLKGKLNEDGLDYIAPRQRSSLKRSPLTQHMRNTMGRWQLFTKCIGDVRIGELAPAHFRKWKEWADRESARRASGRWHSGLMTAVKTVFNYCLRHYPDWEWPNRIEARLRSFTPMRYASPDSNAEPMPRKVFGALISKCDEWAFLNPGDCDASTQSGRGQRLQIIRKQRDGRQMSVVLKLAINCALNAVDFKIMKWSHLKVEEDEPYLDLPREKVKKSLGKATERRIPLIRDVVEALTEWRKVEMSADGHVFHSSCGNPIDPVLISRTIGRLLDECGLDRSFTLRHLRNVGPTLAANAGLSEIYIGRFLGHAPAATSRFYKGRAPASFLQPVVDLIEKAYL